MPTSPTVTVHDGHQIPLLGYGVVKVDDDLAADVVGQALEAGCRHVDTAALYGNEAGVGRALCTCPVPREEVFVTTTLWNDAHAFDAAIAAYACGDRPHRRQYRRRRRPCVALGSEHIDVGTQRHLHRTEPRGGARGASGTELTRERSQRHQQLHVVDRRRQCVHKVEGEPASVVVPAVDEKACRPEVLADSQGPLQCVFEKCGAQTLAARPAVDRESTEEHAGDRVGAPLREGLPCGLTTHARRRHGVVADDLAPERRHVGHSIVRSLILPGVPLQPDIQFLGPAGEVRLAIVLHKAPRGGKEVGHSQSSRLNGWSKTAGRANSLASFSVRTG